MVDLKTIVYVKLVVSLMIVNDDPSLTIVNDKPSLTIVNIIVNNIFFSKTKVFFKSDRFFKKTIV